MYEGGAGSFDDMTNLSKALRTKLANVATVGALEVRLVVSSPTCQSKTWNTFTIPPKTNTPGFDKAQTLKEVKAVHIE